MNKKILGLMSLVLMLAFVLPLQSEAKGSKSHAKAKSARKPASVRAKPHKKKHKASVGSHHGKNKIKKGKKGFKK